MSVNSIDGKSGMSSPEGGAPNPDLSKALKELEQDLSSSSYTASQAAHTIDQLRLKTGEFICNSSLAVRERAGPALSILEHVNGLLTGAFGISFKYEGNWASNSVNMPIYKAALQLAVNAMQDLQNGFIDPSAPIGAPLLDDKQMRPALDSEIQGFSNMSCFNLLSNPKYESSKSDIQNSINTMNETLSHLVITLLQYGSIDSASNNTKFFDAISFSLSQGERILSDLQIANLPPHFSMQDLLDNPGKYNELGSDLDLLYNSLVTHQGTEHGPSIATLLKEFT